MQSQLSRGLMKKLAKEYDLPEYKIKDVINSYFALASFILKDEVDFAKSKFPTVGIPYFGKFYCPKYNQKKIIEYNEDFRARK